MSDAVALRLDDVGAASKIHEVYTDHSWGVGRMRFRGNWIPGLKYLPRFRKWGPYREMEAWEWAEVASVLRQFGARMTVGITAAWVEEDSLLVPFPEKFPEEAEALKGLDDEGLIEIANHGLTHCVLLNNAYRPRLFSGNRTYHREFWEWIPAKIQTDHIRRSQDILQQWLGHEIQTFVPPGNVFCDTTIKAASSAGLQFLSCRSEQAYYGQLWAPGTESVAAFHDREIVLYGVDWLRDLLASHPAGTRLVTVAELAREQLTGSLTDHKSSRELF